jgi:hypothetical protein
MSAQSKFCLFDLPLERFFLFISFRCLLNFDGADSNLFGVAATFGSRRNTQCSSCEGPAHNWTRLGLSFRFIAPW